MSMTELSIISEWQATDFRTLQPIELALMTLLYVFLSRGVRVPVLRLVVLIGLLISRCNTPVIKRWPA
jgi:hypothetical protein